MSEGELKKQISEYNFNQWIRVPKVKKLLDEAKKEFPPFENMPHTHNELVSWIIDHDYKVKLWFEKWFGDKV